MSFLGPSIIPPNYQQFPSAVPITSAYQPMRLSQQQIASSYQPYQPCRPMTQSFVEQIPFERNYVEYVPQQRIDYVPMERKVQDFMEVQHDIDYVPVPRVEKYIEQVPVERYQTHYDYIPQEKSYIKSPSICGNRAGLLAPSYQSGYGYPYGGEQIGYEGINYPYPYSSYRPPFSGYYNASPYSRYGRYRYL